MSWFFNKKRKEESRLNEYRFLSFGTYSIGPFVLKDPFIYVTNDGETLRNKVLEQYKEKQFLAFDTAKLEIFDLSRIEYLSSNEVSENENESFDHFDLPTLFLDNKKLLYLVEGLSKCNMSESFTEYTHLYSRWVNGLYCRAIEEKEDIDAILMIVSNALRNQKISYEDHRDVKFARMVLCLLKYCKDKRISLEHEKQIVSNLVIALEEFRYYLYKPNWDWDPASILIDCGYLDMVSNKLFLKQWLGACFENWEYLVSYSNSNPRYMIADRIVAKVLSKEGISINLCNCNDFAQLRTNRMELELVVSYNHRWKLSETSEKEIFSIINNEIKDF